MDSTEYKKAKDRWNVKSRKVISDSIALVEGQHEELCAKLKGTLDGSPIEKASSHTGGSESDFFEVLLTKDEMQDLIDLLFEMEAAAVPQGDGLGFEEEAG
jgi:hypothetical protein